MTQDLFDLDEALRLKEKGIQQAEAARYSPLEIARKVAFDLALMVDGITSDDVHRLLDRETSEALGPAAGALFRGSEWAWTGEWRQSSKVTNRGRYLRVWRLTI